MKSGRFAATRPGVTKGFQSLCPLEYELEGSRCARRRARAALQRHTRSICLGMSEVRTSRTCRTSSKATTAARSRRTPAPMLPQPPRPWSAPGHPGIAPVARRRPV